MGLTFSLSIPLPMIGVSDSSSSSSKARPTPLSFTLAAFDILPRLSIASQPALGSN